jgi:L-seryl-tRNA(Ser) seleniumtransferase
MSRRDDLRAIPPVDLALRHREEAGVLQDRPRPIVVRAVRAVLERERLALLAGERTYEGSPDDVRAAILEVVKKDAVAAATRNLIRVINATGIVVHTNLGRAPLSEAALASIREVGAGYSNLEYDLVKAARGRRDDLVKDILCELSGAEDALVVNNNAAGVLLALDTLAKGREVVVSRGELIEIGGSFRLPDVFARSGARMVAVGTTNRTRPSDYEAAIRSSTGAILTAHWSNYSIVGFVERVALRDLVTLGERYGIPVIHDLGSGLLIESSALGIGGEMTLAESVASGAAVSTVSGDKLMGGPQAGVVAGRADAVSRMRRNPLARALRPGKLTLAALQATLSQYLMGEALDEVPVLRMITAPIASLERRAASMAETVAGRVGARGQISPTALDGLVGGGAAPERPIESRGVAIVPSSRTAGEVAARLLAASPPIVARTHESRVLIDLRTVLPEDDAVVVEAIVGALKGESA